MTALPLMVASRRLLLRLRAQSRRLLPRTGAALLLGLTLFLDALRLLLPARALRRLLALLGLARLLVLTTARLSRSSAEALREFFEEPVRRTLPASASLSLPVNWSVEKSALDMNSGSSGAFASSHASCPIVFGRVPSSGASKAERGTRTGFSPSRRTDTISRGTSKSTTFAGPSGVFTVAFCLGARLLKSLYASNS